MLQKLKKKMKDQRGMTLIELLAVIVILAIISAIAIPSILGLIDNSKKDSVVANAHQMINSAKLAVAGDEDVRPTDTNKPKYVNLAYLEAEGYLEPIKDVDNPSDLYSKDQTSNKGSNADALLVEPDGSYVKISLNSDKKTYSYSVVLIGSEKSIGTAFTKGSGGTADKAGTPVPENELKRSVVKTK